MTCVHLRELYQLVEKHDIKLGSSDLIRIMCPHCGVQETCPAKHMDEFTEPSEEPDGITDRARLKPDAG